MYRSTVDGLSGLRDATQIVAGENLAHRMRDMGIEPDWYELGATQHEDFVYGFRAAWKS